MASKKKRKRTDDINYWQPSSDLMTALVLVLLLVILLLILYMLQLPEEQFTDYFKYKNKETTQDHDKKVADDHSNHDDHRENKDPSNSNGNGGGNGNGKDNGTAPAEGDGIKSAVYVNVIDGETKAAIKEEGIKFELYTDSGAMQILNTYYPKKTSYKQYETTKEGVFYFPEKIDQGGYYVHQLSKVKGYDRADNVKFKIKEKYDWPDPYVVKVRLYPARDRIRLQLSDSEDGTSIAGGEYAVIAEEDITTQDGTTRVKKGQKVDTIKINDKGYGKSKKLYLGKYVVKQSVIPEYYAENTEEIEKTLSEDKKKDNEEAEGDSAVDNETGKEEVDTENNDITTGDVTEVRLEKTKIEFELVDELTGASIPGADFEVKGPDGSKSMKTDDTGTILLDHVKKDSTYTFSQRTTADDYKMIDSPINVKVSNKGTIDGKATAEVKATNRMIRVSVNVKDAILQNSLPNIKVSILDSKKKEVMDWISGGDVAEITNLEPGKYYIILDGNKDKLYNLTVRDVAEEQVKSIRILTSKSYIAIAIATLLIAALIWLFLRITRKLRARKKAKKKEKQQKREEKKTQKEDRRNNKKKEKKAKKKNKKSEE